MELTNSSIIDVFIAHPGDVSEEVNIIREACEILNAVYNKENIVIRGRDFNDLPSQGVPAGVNVQEIINRELVEKCHIFIGVLRKRIGRDGFKSEIEIGINRFRNEGIRFAFYPRIENGMSEAESAERKALLDQIYPKALCITYRSNPEFRKKISADLAIMIKEIVKGIEAKEKDAIPDQNLSPLPKGEESSSEKEALTENSPTDTLSTVIAKIKDSIADPDSLGDFERIRAYLYSASLLYDTRLPTEVVDAHEIQLLYTFKEQVSPKGIEKKLILQTILGDTYGLKAGWYWVRKIKKIEELAFWFLFTDFSSEEAKIGSLEILNICWENNYLNTLEEFVNNEQPAESVKKKILWILEKHPSKRSLELVRKYLGDSVEGVQERAKRAEISILKTISHHQVTGVLLKDEKGDLYFSSRDLLTKISNKDLFTLTSHKYNLIRIGAFEELIKRKQLKREKLRGLLTDQEWSVKFLAVKGLMDFGESFTVQEVKDTLKSDQGNFSNLFLHRLTDFNERDLTKKIYQKMNMQDLEQLLGWGSEESEIYEILGSKYFAAKKDQIRANLANGFETYKQQLKSQSARRYGMTGSDYEAMMHEYETFITESFIASSLKILLKHGNKSDVSLAEKYLDSTNVTVNELCGQLIAKYGSQKHAVKLFETALRLDKYYTLEFVQQALKMDKSQQYKIIQRCLRSGKEEYINYALSFCYRQSIRISNSRIKELLHNEKDSVRILALAYFINTSTKAAQKRMLQGYGSSGTYYYNVVCWLDRILYAPKNIANHYKEELTNRFVNKW